MKKIILASLTCASLLPSLSFAAALANSTTAAITGEIEIVGDGTPANGGGTGWLNGNNTLFNELGVEYTTAGEVFVGAHSSNAIAYARGVHLGGKGTVFYNTSYGYSGLCVEDIEDVQGTNRSTVEQITAILGTVTGTTATFSNAVESPQKTPNDPDRGYALTGCTVPGTVATP